MSMDVGFVRFRPGLWVVALLAAHMLFAALAPCPFRAAGQVEGHGGHAAGHVHAAAPAATTEPCPYELMHALFGVFKPARPSEPRQSRHQPLVMAVATATPVNVVVFRISLDPPPRSASTVFVS